MSCFLQEASGPDNLPPAYGNFAAKKHLSGLKVKPLDDARPRAKVDGCLYSLAMA